MERPDLKDQDICHLHYTCAKMKEDLGDLDAALRTMLLGVRLGRNYWRMIKSRIRADSQK